MRNKNMKINCWEFEEGNEVPMPSTTTLDGFEWNARFRMTVSNDDGSLGLPFVFAADDTAILTVEKSEQEGKRTGNKKIKQVIRCVPRSLGSEIVCSRTRSYDGNEHVWSAWEITSANSGVDVEWDMNADINTYVTAGIFNIIGERLNANDGLPIVNSNPGHTIYARLTVLDSSIRGSGDNDDKCITQILALSNRTGGDGDVYIRTGRASIKNLLAGGSGWEPWGKLQQNVQVGQVTSLDGFTGNGMYSGVYTDGTFFETFVMVVINNYAVAGATGNVRCISQFKYALNVNSNFSYKTRTGRGGSTVEWGSWVDLGAADTADIQDGAITAQKLSSDVRENVEKVQSLEENATKEKNALVNGDTIVGLAREVYSRQGKVDTATFLKRTTAGGTSVSDGVATLKQIGGNIVKNLVDTSFVGSETLGVVNGHIYYFSSYLYNGQLHFADTSTGVCGGWKHHGIVLKATSGSVTIAVEGDNALNVLLIDLTEMFGAGKEPTKEGCDRMFACMGALPQGLTVAQPTGLKSTGFNQWNPANVLLNKSIVENAIEDDVADRHIAIVECLPCNTGTGENNGYVIGYGEGDTWSDDGIEVYLTPLNPMEVDGELYLQKLDKDATYGTYVPQIKGYLLVVTPTTDKLCAHFHWSGDRATTDYEPYVESSVGLPVIPEMSEWGLAGIINRVQDTIDFDRMVYTKRLTKKKLNNVRWTHYPADDAHPYGFFVGFLNGIKLSDPRNVFPSTKYTCGVNFLVDKTVLGNTASGGNAIYIIDSEFNDSAALNANLADVDFYMEIAPEEYPIVSKAAPNYIGSDYGIEEFTGSKVPLAANIMFYMRSLVSETRNFIDRLMAGLGTSDATAVADRIVAAVTASEQPTVVSDEQMAE